ncbi:PH domain-containing protein [Dactylosporangium sp. AC04546]|uniref:PH domain-containing protein n=1 Tax=Dactylosporangium sp. AC04546 TaxID=2862460 RepID=UPI001EDC9B9E|nr:PH domain-containing protein [Dactylosporangium sp. AC04546]WVK81660.1 PH domain-containing protein [Dactylosporangium sp. AC04546]
MSSTVTARPQRARIIAYVLAAVVVVVFTLIAFGLHGKTGDGPGYFQRGDQAAMIGLGLCAAAGILLMTRPRVVADERGVRVRNIIGSYDLPWEVVRAVTFGRGAPWLTLDLEDDERVAVMAVQMADKDYAVQAARSLRALHSASRVTSVVE